MWQRLGCCHSLGGALVAEEKTVADWKIDEQAAGQIVLSAAKTAEE